MLKFGDPDREGLRSGIESSEVLFEFGRAAGEPGDLGEKLGPQRGTGAAQLQARPQGKDRRDEGDERAREYQDDQEHPHSRLTVARERQTLQSAVP